jgi:hypothetical protein
MSPASKKDLVEAEPTPATIGFALGGLGGFNGYGVGFLQAARTLGVKPAIITCTSGMIAWVARWLDGEDLEPLLLAQIQESTKFPPSLEVRTSKCGCGSTAPTPARLPGWLRSTT